MAERRSRSAAANELDSLATLGRWGILGFTIVVVVAGLAFLYPKAALIERVTHEEDDHYLAIAYLQSLVRTNPGNASLSLQLAKRHLDVGDLSSAHAILKRLGSVKDPVLRRQAWVIEWSALEIELYASETSAERAGEVRKRLFALLADLLREPTEASTLIAAAQQAIALGDAEVGRRLYLHILEAGATTSIDPEDYENAAAAALSIGDYRSAAALWFGAQRASASFEERFVHFRRGVDQLIAGNLQWEAVAAAEKHGSEFASTDAMMFYLVDLARSSGDAGIVARHAGQLRSHLLVESSPHEPGSFERASDIALSVGDYRGAADLLFAVQRITDSLAGRKATFAKALGILVSASLLTDALAAAERHGAEFNSDGPTLVLLLRLARAANDSPRAERYARQLIRMKSAPSAALLERVLGWVISSAQAQDAERADDSLRPFHAEYYELAFNEFLARRNLAAAYRLALAAVQQAPVRLDWRERLAQVAEWHGKPQEALKQWLEIARRNNSDKSINEVFRLAPGLHDDEAFVVGWQLTGRKRALSRAEQTLVVEAFERLGRPSDAIAVLEQQFAQANDADFLDTIATLHLNAGRPADAEAVMRRVVALKPTLDRVIRLAGLRLQAADYRGAYEELQRAESLATDTDLRYWRLVSEVAWTLQQEPVAERALGKLTQLDQAAPTEFERLVQLIRGRDAGTAARIAETGFRRTGSRALLMVAFEIYWQDRNLSQFGRLLASLTPTEKSVAGSTTFFHTLSANYHQASGAHREAQASLRRGLVQSPYSTDLRTALIYALVEGRETESLRASLREYAKDAEANPAYWDAYAAGYATLGEHRRAVGFLSRQAPKHATDFLWLVNFADVLEGAGNIGVAARVRRQAWDEARRRRLADPDVFTNRAALHAYARMVTQYEPGDASLAVIRQVLAGTRDNGGRVEVAAKELVLAWGLSTEQFDASRAWLWSQYGRNLARPVWARAQLAISETDRETLESLLAMDERAVPSLNRMEVAGALEHIPMVQTLAFEALERQPADEGAHERLVEDLPKSAPHLALQTELFERGILRGAKAVATAQLWLTPLVGVAPYLVEQTQKSTDQESLVGVPANDRRAGAKTRIRHQYGDTELDIGHRHALGSFAYLSIQHTKPATTGLQTTVGVALNAETLESVPLAVGGKKNEIDIILNYSFSRREYVRARPWAADYSAQTGGSLGSASGIEWEAGYRVRLDYPDLAVRLSGTHFRARPVDLANPSSAVLNPGGSAPAGSFFLPPNFNFYSLSVGFGEQYEQQYTRGLRVFGSAGPTWSDIAGTGFNFLLGAGRAILGSDYLSIFARRSEGGLGRSSRLKSFGLHYKYHF